MHVLSKTKHANNGLTRGDQKAKHDHSECPHDSRFFSVWKEKGRLIMFRLNHNKSQRYLFSFILGHSLFLCRKITWISWKPIKFSASNRKHLKTENQQDNDDFYETLWRFTAMLSWYWRFEWLAFMPTHQKQRNRGLQQK